MINITKAFALIFCFLVDKMVPLNINQVKENQKLVTISSLKKPGRQRTMLLGTIEVDTSQSIEKLKSKMWRQLAHRITVTWA